MDNAQEAIEDYKKRRQKTCRVSIAKIVTDKTVTLILDHEYSDKGNVRYLIQQSDGLQKWVNNIEEYQFEWIELLKEYWANEASAQDDSPEDDP